MPNAMRMPANVAPCSMRSRTNARARSHRARRYVCRHAHRVWHRISLTMARSVVFSGIQPTGAIHIGNYFGAIKQWVSGQDDAENIFCLVDMHALTVAQDPDVLREQILETATVLIAAGIDQAKSRLFVQSHVREHGELAWYLSCVASMGQLERMTQF